mmetsp:Transcript_101235/g.301946  ORF Transcript_101235/g.301946 Transcript_101235/m.301946 type:complete len:297 (-) Transcript_101235:235-1125(-)
MRFLKEVACCASATHRVHTRCRPFWSSSCMELGEHWAQTHLPHSRQWCLGRKYLLPSFAPQLPQAAVSSSQSAILTASDSSRSRAPSSRLGSASVTELREQGRGVELAWLALERALVRTGVPFCSRLRLRPALLRAPSAASQNSAAATALQVDGGWSLGFVPPTAWSRSPISSRKAVAEESSAARSSRFCFSAANAASAASVRPLAAASASPTGNTAPSQMAAASSNVVAPWDSAVLSPPIARSVAPSCARRRFTVGAAQAAATQRVQALCGRRWPSRCTVLEEHPEQTHNPQIRQ